MKNRLFSESDLNFPNSRLSESNDRPENRTVAEESPLEIIVNSHWSTVLMRTPGDEDVLIAGHLFAEGLIQSHADIESISCQTYAGPFQTTGCRAQVRVRPESQGLPSSTPCLASSGARIATTDLQPNPISRPATDEPHVERSMLLWCHADMVKHQPLYRLTRGMHGAALYKTDGGILGCCEDVGRHNAMDKVIGKGLMEAWPFEETIMVFSGRGSLEMVLKTVRAGVPVLVCTSAPTSLAVRAADTLGLTLVKPERSGGLTIFSHPNRIED